MEAATLKKKKQVNKGKLKKTFKNILCRPDPVFWPQTSADEEKLLQEVLNKYKVEIPEFKKPCWSELSHIPKKLRPKPPPIPKVDGLIFGIIECQKAIETNESVGVLVEATVNPKTIVQTLMNACTEKSVPVLCLKELRKITKLNYGIPTTALGVKKNCLKQLEQVIIDISKCHRPPKQDIKVADKENDLKTCLYKEIEEMAVDEEKICPYLYRTDNKTRVFTPNVEDVPKSSNKFIGQDFIGFSNGIPQERTERKQYMKMIVKKISSNPNRKKRSKKISKDQ